MQGKLELDMLASSLIASKAELEATNKRAVMWQTKATISERTCSSEKQDREAASAAHEEQVEELRAEVQRAVEDVADARLEAQQARREVQRLQSVPASFLLAAASSGLTPSTMHTSLAHRACQKR